MVIKNDIYKLIVSTVDEKPPESGGILGGVNGIITRVIFDEGLDRACSCNYVPDVNMMNRKIAQWEEESVDFMGIFHTHYFGVKTLSEGDKVYIDNIMKLNAEFVNFLFFPVVVLPERKIVAYKAVFLDGITKIEHDTCKIINTSNE